MEHFSSHTVHVYSIKLLDNRNKSLISYQVVPPCVYSCKSKETIISLQAQFNFMHVKQMHFHSALWLLCNLNVVLKSILCNNEISF